MNQETVSLHSKNVSVVAKTKSFFLWLYNKCERKWITTHTTIDGLNQGWGSFNLGLLQWCFAQTDAVSPLVRYHCCLQHVTDLTCQHISGL